MNLLILGGTIFVGRHIAEAALERGHTVTLFHRGQHTADGLKNVATVRGDRDGGLNALAGHTWDAVIDTCGYVPRLVGDSARFLADSVGHYTFISSISAYADFKNDGIDETYPAGTPTDPAIEEVNAETYGPLKVLCEQAAEAAMPGRAWTVRPGLIVGPHDPTDRFTCWVHRIAQGGGVLAPEPPDAKTQFLDARDLAEWTVRGVEAKLTGIYNATGPDYPLTFGQVLETCRAVSGSDAQFVWMDTAFLLTAEVKPWTELPLWIGGDADMAGFAAINCEKATAAGLTFRPLADTVRDTLAWDATRPPDIVRKNGMTRERESALLRMWRENGSPGQAGG